MKRILVLLALAALALPTAASAKGPVSASIEGPGTGGGIKLTGGGENFGTTLGNLAQYAGFFPAAFGQEPSPMLGARPQGDLGPRYTITYEIPGEIKQYVYPYASPPATYMPPGQDLYGADATKGGWFRADEQLKTTLVSAGLPKTAPGESGLDVGSISTGLISLLGAALVLGATTMFVLRRRARPATAA
jgi:hypothetical protein